MKKNRPPGISNIADYLLKNLNKKVHKSKDKVWVIDKYGKKWLINKEEEWETTHTSS